MTRWAKASISGAVVGLVGVIISLFPFGFQLEEDLGLDLLFRLRGAKTSPANVVVIGMDSASAKALSLSRKPERWPRDLHARLVNGLAEHGATVVVFDVILDEPRQKDHDLQFADALRSAGNVVLCEYLQQDYLPFQSGTKNDSRPVNIEKQIFPIPLFENAAAGTGPFPLPKVPVKTSRFWTFKKGAGGVPTLPVVAFFVYARSTWHELVHLVGQEAPDFAAQLSPDGRLPMTIRSLRIGLKNDPHLFETIANHFSQSREGGKAPSRIRIVESMLHLLQNPDSRYLNFYGPPGSIHTVSYFQALESVTHPETAKNPIDFKNKAVFVGYADYSRPQKKDEFHTVFSQPDGIDISGVEIAATAFANLLENVSVYPLRSGWYLILTGGWGIALGMLCFQTTAVIAALGTIGIGSVYLLLCSFLFNRTGTWLPLTSPLFIQIPVAYFGTLAWKFFDVNKERQRIKKAFGYYLPNDIVHRLATNLTHVKTTSQTVYGTCLFTDAGQYTSLAESMAPDELSKFMNKYYETIFEPVRKHGGIISDVVGDSMMAIWATADPDARLRQSACRAALDVQRAVRRFNRAPDTHPLTTRIGLHSGYITLGNIGAMDHFEYRPVGDIVNTASRMEGLNKYLGTRVLVSEEVIVKLDDFLLRHMGRFILAGKNRSIVAYELIDRKEMTTEHQRALCKTFESGINAFSQHAWVEAMEYFEACLKIRPADAPSTFYLNWCIKYQKYPSEAIMNGIIRLENK